MSKQKEQTGGNGGPAQEPTQVAPRPSPASTLSASTVPFIENVRHLLDRSKDQIRAALPRHLTADRMIRVALTSLRKLPDLWQCDPVSVLGCIIQASQLGLEIDGVLGQAYLVPFNDRHSGTKQAQLIVGYKGYLSLARRSGDVVHFAAHVVHANDRFKCVYGTESQLLHEPSLADPGEPIAVYAVLKLQGGGHDFEVIPWPKILECQEKYAKKDRSGRMYGTWVDHLEEMARKTAIRRLAKRCPLSTEIQTAASLDGQAEAGERQSLDVNLSDFGISRTDQIMGRLGGPSQASQGIASEQVQHIQHLLADLNRGEAEWYELASELQVPGNLHHLTPQQAARVIDHLQAEKDRLDAEDHAEREAIQQAPKG